jgi:hypothetical protein
VVRPFISPSLNLEPTERQRGNMCAIWQFLEH